MPNTNATDAADATAVVCPTCDAHPGAPCRSSAVTGRTIRQTPHTTRVELAAVAAVRVDVWFDDDGRPEVDSLNVGPTAAREIATDLYDHGYCWVRIVPAGTDRENLSAYPKHPNP